MGEHDPLVLSYVHLRHLPREKEALHILRKVASLVKPIMRARKWMVRELAEFFPDEPNLLGLNVNRGQRILLRLRYPGDSNQFLPVEQVTDTMLHELSHIVHGPHDGKFHALWNQLRDEHEGLLMKGYTGEGFLTKGHTLGGKQVPKQEARRLARAAAERRQTTGAGSGQRLGGATPRPGQDIRRTIVNAVDRRNNTLRGCGNTNHNEQQIRQISETATKNGFRTQAEEDAANEAAISQALWELVQEDEQRKLGNSYIPPSPQNPAGNGGWSGNWGGSEVVEDVGDSRSLPTTRNDPSKASGSKSAAVTKPVTPRPETTAPPPGLMQGWSCTICTLQNPAHYLCCDACGTERSAGAAREMVQRETKRPRTTASSASSSRVTTATKPSAPAHPTVAATWTCSFCGNSMARQWWTCSMCGTMKDRS